MREPETRGSFDFPPKMLKIDNTCKIQLFWLVFPKFVKRFIFKIFFGGNFSWVFNGTFWFYKSFWIFFVIVTFLGEAQFSKEKKKKLGIQLKFHSRQSDKIISFLRKELAFILRWVFDLFKMILSVMFYFGNR